MQRRTSRFWARSMLVMLWALPGFQAAQASGLEGRAAPALTLPDPAGETRTLASLAAGRPAIVVFWASWCPYCKALLPHLQSMLDEFGTERLEVVAINLWEDKPDAWQADISGGGFDFRILLGGESAAESWGVKGTPGLFLISGSGQVVFDRNSREFKPRRRDAGMLAGELGNREKAARQAPLWAAELRREIRRLLPP